MNIKLVSGGNFSRQESMVASEKLIDSPSWVADLGVVMTSVNPDGSGLTVHVAGDAPSSQVRADLEKFLTLPGGVMYVTSSEPVVPQ